MSPNLDYSSLEDAIQSLKDALSPPPRNDRERDGAIQRFEYTFELCWKFIRRYFLAIGKSDISTGPRPLIRDAHQENLIPDPLVWFTFLDARNNGAHTYDKNEADKVFKVAVTFPPHADALLSQLKLKLSNPNE